MARRETLPHARLLAVAGLVVATVSAATPAAAAESPQAASLSVAQDNTSVRVAEGGRLLMVYRHREVPRKPYVAELRTPGGMNVLRDAPHDHLHHHGLMFAVGVDGVDFWSENAKCGRQVGQSLAASAAQATGQGATAELSQQIAWLPPEGDEPLMVESRRLRLRVPEGETVTLLTWVSRLEPGPGKSSVTLGGSHYFGLGMRFVESMDSGGRHFNASGKPGEVFRGEERLVRARWCAYTAKADGKPVTVALFDSPDNSRHPATMFTMPRPFAYLSATLNLKKEPLRAEAGKPLELRYGVALWDGEADADAVEATYRAWVASAGTTP